MSIKTDKPIAIVTGADGGMGMEITRALVLKDFHVIMACRNTEKANIKCEKLRAETGKSSVEVREVELSSAQSIISFVQPFLDSGCKISLLMNNAAMMPNALKQTPEGVEETIAVNYLAPFLLTHLLLPLMEEGSRVVSMVSCTYTIGKVDYPHFFEQGCRGTFYRIPVYSNSKLALLLFSFALAEKVKERGIAVHLADPGIVSTNIIRMKKWFDPLADIFFRPLIHKPQKGASTAINLLLGNIAKSQTGTLYRGNKEVKVSSKYRESTRQNELWSATESVLQRWCRVINA